MPVTQISDEPRPLKFSRDPNSPHRVLTPCPFAAAAAAPPRTSRPRSPPVLMTRATEPVTVTVKPSNDRSPICFSPVLAHPSLLHRSGNHHLLAALHPPRRRRSPEPVPSFTADDPSSPYSISRNKKKRQRRLGLGR
ncbi:hypothetical protein M0R45_013782 [Rubus argutus]|uniref:Uncharacterized protein n=1 Tax=Rubus argutus TaxID=59490 RepID=A0AAW1XKR5_RUBAR